MAPTSVDGAPALLGATPARLRTRAVLCVLSLLSAVLALSASLPAIASASLPDNRIYEQASPADKDGNVIFPSKPFAEEFGARLGAQEGNAVLFTSTGAVGNDSNQGGIQENISRRIPGEGWATEPADPRQIGQLGLLQSPELPAFYAAPNDFSRLYFDPRGCCVGGRASYVSEEPTEGLDFKLYMSENPLAAPTWIGKPQIAHPIPEPGEGFPGWEVAGLSPDGSTMYFDYSGTLLKEDEEPFKTNGKGEPEPGGRSALIGNGMGGGPWGLYEWSNGTLSEAGILPNGMLNQYGAITAANAAAGRGEEGVRAEERDNQVSEDGKRVFFVSPDPQGGAPPSEPPELYMREALANGEHRSVLVSRDPLLPNVKEETSKKVEEEFPAQAPGGVGTVSNAGGPETGGGSYAYASPDGSRVFFSSASALTSAVAPHSEFSVYMTGTSGHFKLEVTNNSSTQTTAPIPWEATAAQVQSALEALSNVGAGNVTVAAGPSGIPNEYRITFPSTVVPKVELNAAELVGDYYSYASNVTAPNVYEYDVANESLNYLPQLGNASFAAASNDGSRVMFVSSTGDLDLLTIGAESASVETIAAKINSSVTPARAAGNGSAFMFYASSGGTGPLSQFNNDGFSQFYRYDVASKEVICVSCPPPGTNATGPAETNFNTSEKSVQPVRMMSEDGTRIFFQSPDPLVGADVNGVPDVYEWENGHLYLISGGNAPAKSTYYDNSRTGGDVFFSTGQGLIPSDEDAQNDVYDARIPRPGDRPPVNETPCSGEVCQGPPSVPQLLSPAASATFEGLGNIPPQEAVKVTTSPVVKCKKGFVKKSGKCVKQTKKKKKAKKKAKKGKKSATSKRRGK